MASQVETLKGLIKNKSVATEAKVVHELLKIHNTAMLRLQTCSKFSLDAPQEEELQERLLYISDDIKTRHF